MKFVMVLSAMWLFSFILGIGAGFLVEISENKKPMLYKDVVGKKIEVGKYTYQCQCRLHGNYAEREQIIPLNIYRELIIKETCK